jgi:hypothetical protein
LVDSTVSGLSAFLGIDQSDISNAASFAPKAGFLRLLPI